MTQTGLILLIVTGGLLFGLLYRWSRLRKGSFVDPNSPEWIHAALKAQATVPVLRELYDAGVRPILVKFPLRMTTGDREHVWGELLAMGVDDFSASLETRPLNGAPPSDPPFTVALSELEDWQAMLENGSIRGGFTTQVEIELRRGAGQSIPKYLREMEARFVDRSP